MPIELNKQQKIAVETESKRALVLASAGSGKTRVLTERIAHLIENKKVSPYEILAITFTRLAAGEMRERLNIRLGGACTGINVGTMHAFALKVIHQFCEQLNLRSNSTVYSEWEEDVIIRDVAASMGALKGKTWKIPKRDIYNLFQGYYQTGSEPDDDLPGHNVFKGVMARFRENNALSYGNLLIDLRALIPILGQHLNIKYIFVDEIQDNDALQWSIIEEMCSVFHASLFVVGDIDQAIFSFRGACPEYLVKHQNTFDIYHLSNNYRSIRSIVECVNRLIKNNTLRIDHSMISTIESDVVPDLIKNMDTDAIVDYLNDPKRPQPDAILSRNHFLLQKLSKHLSEAGILHNYVGRQSKLTNTEAFRRFNAFLKLRVNPFDNFSFLLIKDLIGVTMEEYTQIRIKAATRMVSHFQAWKSKNTDSDWYREFFSWDSDNDDAGMCLNVLADLLDNDFEFALSYTFATNNLPASNKLQDYLDWLAVYDIQDEVVSQCDVLQLMTIHAAKGLEWPNVMVIGCNEDLIPSKQAIKNDDIESERRLFYVAITRAQEGLILAVRPEIKEYHGKVYANPISRFVDETGV